MNCDAVSAVSPRFADHVDDRLLDLRRDQIDHRLDLIRIDIIQHEKLRPRARAVGHQVVCIWIERVLQSDVAQRAAADAQHDQHIAAIAKVLDLALLTLLIMSSIVRQIAEAQSAGFALGDHLLMNLFNLRRERFEFLFADAVLVADRLGGSVLLVKADAIHVLPARVKFWRR